MKKTHACVAIAIAGLVGVTESRAEPTDADRALATQLFREGKALLDQKNYGAACPKLEESERLDPGGGTILNLAVCHLGQGRLATAWTELHVALGMARRDNRDDRIEVATRLIPDVEGRLSGVTIVVPSEADVPGLEIRRDGTVVGRAAWGTLIPLDPGEHVFEATAPGRIGWRADVSIKGEAERRTVPVSVLEMAPLPSPPTNAPPVVTPMPTPVAEPRAVEPPRDRGAAARIMGAIEISVGGAAVTAGAVAGAFAISKRHASDALCVPLCTADAYAVNDQAKSFADGATAAFALGAATLVAGGVSLGVGIAAGTGTSRRIVARIGPRGVAVAGAF